MNNLLKTEATIYLVGGLAVVLALWYVKNKVTGVAGDVYEAAADAASAAAAAVSSAATTAATVVASSVDSGVSGIAFGIGDAIGVPRTNATQCQKDIAAGDGWSAFSSCPFADYANAFLR